MKYFVDTVNRSDVRHMFMLTRRVNVLASRRGREIAKKLAIPAVNRYTLKLFARIINNSPVRTGYYLSRWRMRINSLRGQNQGDIIYSNVLSNDTPYGKPIELGSELGQPPWPTVAKPPLGKTVLFNSRVYIKGAEGGVMGKALRELPPDELAKEVHTAINPGRIF